MFSCSIAVHLMLAATLERKYCYFSCVHFAGQRGKVKKPRGHLQSHTVSKWYVADFAYVEWLNTSILSRKQMSSSMDFMSFWSQHVFCASSVQTLLPSPFALQVIS